MQIIQIAKANPIYTTLTHAYHQIKSSKYQKMLKYSYFLVHLKGKKVDTVPQNWNYVNELLV